MKYVELGQSLSSILNRVVDELDKMPRQDAIQYMKDLGISDKKIEDIMNDEKENVDEGICGK